MSRAAFGKSRQRDSRPRFPRVLLVPKLEFGNARKGALPPNDAYSACGTRRAAVKIRILDRAEDDLAHGFSFYEQQAAGIGTYFLDTLASDIDSLRLYAGIHALHFRQYHRMYRSVSPSPSTTPSRTNSSPCMQSSTAGEIQRGCGCGCGGDRQRLRQPRTYTAGEASASIDPPPPAS